MLIIQKDSDSEFCLWHTSLFETIETVLFVSIYVHNLSKRDSSRTNCGVTPLLHSLLQYEVMFRIFGRSGFSHFHNALVIPEKQQLLWIASTNSSSMIAGSLHQQTNNWIAFGRRAVQRKKKQSSHLHCNPWNVVPEEQQNTAICQSHLRIRQFENRDYGNMENYRQVNLILFFFSYLILLTHTSWHKTHVHIEYQLHNLCGFSLKFQAVSHNMTQSRAPVQGWPMRLLQVFVWAHGGLDAGAAAP